MPVVYSAVIASTPSTPIASWAKFTPARFARRGLKCARSCGARCGQRASKITQTRIPMPTISSSAIEQ